MDPKNPFATQEARIERIIPETPRIRTFIVKPNLPIPFQPGQFMELSIPGIGEAPFAPSSFNDRPEILEFTVQNVGYMTSFLHQMKAGEKLCIRGPYGKGFPIAQFYNKTVLLVIGGVGFPPARTLLYTLLKQKKRISRIVLCYGARTPKDIVYKYQLSYFKKHLELYLTVDDPGKTPWKGHTGVVTSLLDEISFSPQNTLSVVIGPPVMMKYAVRKLLERGFSPDTIIVSMERKMYCGIGQCRHCMIGPYFVCKDGPVFSYATLQNLFDVWEA